MKAFTILVVFTLSIAGAAAPMNPQNSNADRTPVQDDIQRTLSGVELELSNGAPGEVPINTGDVDRVISFLSRGRLSATVTRVFQKGVEVDRDTVAIDRIERASAVVDPVGRTISITGSLGGESVREDIWMAGTPEVTYVIHDVYLDANESTELSGRAAGLPLADAIGGEVPARSASEVTIAAATAAPWISSIGGLSSSDLGINNGSVSMSCGGNYNGGRAVNDSASTYYWVISGMNFGATGSVTVNGVSCYVSSWSPTRIVAYPTMPWYSQPNSVTLVVSTLSGRGYFGVWAIPACRSRIYGQCTHWVAYNRLSMGLQPSSTAYGGYTTITTSWLPHVGDQLQWQGRHTAIITAVYTYYNGGWVRANLQISERNADCNNGVHVYWDYFEIGYNNGYKWVNHYPQSSVRSFGSCTSYFR